MDGVMRIGAIIQARMNSTRLPGKVVKKLPNGLSVIENIIMRVAAIPVLNEIIVASPEADHDSELHECVLKSGVEVFWGEADDVLSRYYLCAKQHQLDVILRVTADDPFREHSVESAVLQVLVNDAAVDYVRTSGLPEGINAEAFTMRALTKAYHEAKLQSEREHVTPYIWKNPQLFNCKQLNYVSKLEHCRLTLDFPEDWELISKIDAALYQVGEMYLLKDIMNFLEKNPELVTLNNYIEYNSGYKKSVAEDKLI